MNSTNWSSFLPSLLEIIICDKIFVWGSVVHERTYYKMLSLIKDYSLSVKKNDDIHEVTNGNIIP